MVDSEMNHEEILLDISSEIEKLKDLSQGDKRRTPEEDEFFKQDYSCFF
jgi:hypothetical protein